MRDSQISELAKVFKLSKYTVSQICKGNKVLTDPDWRVRDRCSALAMLLKNLNTSTPLSTEDISALLHLDNAKIIKFTDIYSVLKGKFAKLIKAQPCFKYSTVTSQHVSTMLYSEDFAKVFYKAWKIVTNSAFDVTSLLRHEGKLDKNSIKQLRELIK